MMQKVTRLWFLALALLILGADNAAAQFEGVVRFEISNPSSGSDETRQLSLVFSPDRIFITSDLSMNLMAGLRAQGVMARNDMNDFVILTDEDEGLKVDRAELDNLMMLVNRMQGKDPNARPEPFRWEERVSETGRTQRVGGYEVIEFVLEGDEGEKISVWLTDQIKVRWGNLQDAWYTVGSAQFENEVPIEMVMNNNSFPLLVEVVRNDNLIYRARAEEVVTPLPDRRLTELPANMQLIGLTDLMMNIFRQQ